MRIKCHGPSPGESPRPRNRVTCAVRWRWSGKLGNSRSRVGTGDMMTFSPSRGLLFGSLFALVTATACKRQLEESAATESVASAGRSAAATTAPPTPVTSASPRPSASGGTRSEAGSGSNLELLELGTAPRSKLRYTFKRGQSDELELTQKMTLSMRLGNEVMPETPAPETTLVIKLDITDLVDDVATARFSITDATMSWGPRASLGAGAGVERLVDDLKSYSGTQRVDRRGVLRSFAQDTSGITNPQISQMMNSMEQSMTQMMAPLPEEAVGQGAKWRTVTRADQFGLKLNQTALFEVQSIDDEGVDLKVVLSQSAPAGKLSAPGLPPGVAVDLVSMHSSGEAKMRIDLERLIPRSDMNMSVKMKMSVPDIEETGAGEQIMDMTINMVMRVVPRPCAGCARD